MTINELIKNISHIELIKVSRITTDGRTSDFFVGETKDLPLYIRQMKVKEFHDEINTVIVDI